MSSITRVLTLLAAAAALSSPAFSQRGGANSRTNSVGLYLSGHVALEDGSVPKEKVVIESNCGGSVRQETTADRNGGFGFTLGQGSGDLMLEATNTANRAGSSMSSTDRTQCSLRAILPGYTSQVVYLANLEPTRPDVGTIVLHKVDPNAGSAASATSAKAPKEARKAFDKGADAVKKKKFDEAEKSFQKAVEVYPEYAEAWYQLAYSQVQLKKFDEARKSLEGAVKADAKYIQPYLLLIALDNQAQDWKTVAELTEKVFQLAPPGSPQLYFYNAAAYYWLRNLEAAEKSARKGLELDVQHQVPRLHQVVASALSVRGDYAGAADQLRQYLQFSPFAPDAEAMKTQIAELEKRAQAAPPRQ